MRPRLRSSISAMSALQDAEAALAALAPLPLGARALPAGRDDHRLAFLERATRDLREPAIGDARGDFSRLRLALDQHVDRALYLTGRSIFFAAASGILAALATLTSDIRATL